MIRALAREYAGIDPILRRCDGVHFHAALFRDEPTLRAPGSPTPEAEVWWLWRRGDLVEIDEASFWGPHRAPTSPERRPLLVDLKVAPEGNGVWVAHHFVAGRGRAEGVVLELFHGDHGLDYRAVDILWT